MAMTTPAPVPDGASAIPVAALLGITAAICSFAMAQGLSYPLFTLLMQKQGLSPAEIGLSAAMTPIGLMVSSLIVPAQVRRYGARRLSVASALVAALLFAVVGFRQDFLAWYPVRFLLGMAINPLYILGEVWIMALAPAARRGRIMGMFNAATGLGYASGPFALSLLGSDGWPPLMIGVIGFLGCTLLIAWTASDIAGFGDGSAPARGGVVGFWLVAPGLLTAVTVSSAVQTSTYSLIPVFAAAYGADEARRAALASVMSLGNILLQVPLGLLAERHGYRAMVLVCALTTGTLALLLPQLVTTPLVWPLVLAMGGFGYGVYTMSLVGLGNRFRGADLVAGNSAFALMWGAGGIAGPPASGLAMQHAGPAGLPAVLSLLSYGLVAFTAWRVLARRPP